MKCLIAIILAIIVILSVAIILILIGCSPAQGVVIPHIEQMPAIVKHNINDLKVRAEYLKGSQVELLEKASRVREFEVSPEILLRVSISP